MYMHFIGHLGAYEQQECRVYKTFPKNLLASYPAKQIHNVIRSPQELY